MLFLLRLGWIASFSHHMIRPRLASSRNYARSRPCFMPEGPECRLHAESLNARFAGHTLRRAAILSGRYLGNGTTPGRGAPPENWDTLRSALPAVIVEVSVSAAYSRVKSSASSKLDKPIELSPVLAVERQVYLVVSSSRFGCITSSVFLEYLRNVRKLVSRSEYPYKSRV